MCVLCNQFYKQRNDYGILKNYDVRAMVKMLVLLT